MNGFNDILSVALVAAFLLMLYLGDQWRKEIRSLMRACGDADATIESEHKMAMALKQRAEELRLERDVARERAERAERERDEQINIRESFQDKLAAVEQREAHAIAAARVLDGQIVQIRSELETCKKSVAEGNRLIGQCALEKVEMARSLEGTGRQLTDARKRLEAVAQRERVKVEAGDRAVAPAPAVKKTRKPAKKHAA